MIHDVVVHFVTTVWRRNPGSSVAALCDRGVTLCLFTACMGVCIHTHTIRRQS